MGLKLCWRSTAGMKLGWGKSTHMLLLHKAVLVLGAGCHSHRAAAACLGTYVCQADSKSRRLPRMRAHNLCTACWHLAQPQGPTIIESFNARSSNLRTASDA